MNTFTHIAAHLLIGTFLLLVSGTGNQAFSQDDNEFSIVGVSQNPLIESVEERITDIKDAINNHETWGDFSITGSNPGIEILNQLVNNYQISSVRSAKRLYLLNKPDGSVTIRNLFVKTSKIDTLEHKELMLHFNRDAQLIDAKLVPDKQNYQLILDRKIEVPSTTKNHIQNFVESYQQNLADKNIAHIHQLLDSDAYLVSGSIGQYNTDTSEASDFRYLAMSKEEYLQRLSRYIFRKYKHININTGPINIYAHPFIDDLYAATFPQKWSSKEYSDNGYVVMVIYMQPEPKLVLRTWKEHKPETGYLRFEPNYVTDIAIPKIAAPYQFRSDLQSLPVKTPQQISKANFFKTYKRWLIISAATTTAVGLGISLFMDDGSGELPNPPGRPTFQ